MQHPAVEGAPARGRLRLHRLHRARLRGARPPLPPDPQARRHPDRPAGGHAQGLVRALRAVQVGHAAAVEKPTPTTRWCRRRCRGRQRALGPRMSRLVLGPFNRVEGDLEVSLEVEAGRVRAAQVTAPLYRGFEGVLVGKTPLDALVFVPRICGICSVSQSAAGRRRCARRWAWCRRPTASARRRWCWRRRTSPTTSPTSTSSSCPTSRARPIAATPGTPPRARASRRSRAAPPPRCCRRARPSWSSPARSPASGRIRWRCSPAAARARWR